MHYIADKVEQAINVPLIHIADATANEIKKADLKTVALLGTKYTMQFNFLKDRLLTYGINPLIPDEDGIEKVNAAIFNELGKGIIYLKQNNYSLK